jgi:hypothetical protein
MNKNKQNVPSSTEKTAEGWWSTRMRTSTIIMRPEDELESYKVHVDLWLNDLAQKRWTARHWLEKERDRLR